MKAIGCVCRVTGVIVVGCVAVQCYSEGHRLCLSSHQCYSGRLCSCTVVADLVDFDDPVYKARREVVELEEILPDIMGKVGRGVLTLACIVRSPFL